MHIRLTCDITQEQIDEGYDFTLLAIHSRFVAWILTLELPIVSFAIYWEHMEDGTPHLFATAELRKDSEVSIDEPFLDELHLGGKEDA
tara:strand:- start:173 stop:436 length:264 start_codon:yes stop_codon:yes gene_type:complete